MLQLCLIIALVAIALVVEVLLGDISDLSKSFSMVMSRSPEY